MMKRLPDGILFFFICIFAAALSSFVIAKSMTSHLRTSPPSPVALTVSPNEVIVAGRDSGDETSAPYILVEFMDYQCPPCKRSEPALRAVLNRYKGKLKRVIRNFPLTFHKHAYSAATAAEATRGMGKYWPVHDALMEADLPDDEHIRRILAQQRLDAATFERLRTSTAAKIVDSDMRLAASLGINGTPSYVLCCPDKKVYRLYTLAQLDQFVK